MTQKLKQWQGKVSMRDKKKKCKDWHKIIVQISFLIFYLHYHVTMLSCNLYDTPRGKMPLELFNWSSNHSHSS